jgi:hypothetical protein
MKMLEKQASKLEVAAEEQALELAALQEDMELPLLLKSGGQLPGFVVQLKVTQPLKGLLNAALLDVFFYANPHFILQCTSISVLVLYLYMFFSLVGRTWRLGTRARRRCSTAPSSASRPSPGWCSWAKTATGKPRS